MLRSPSDSSSSSESSESSDDEIEYQIHQYNPPELHQKNMIVINTKNNGTLFGYTSGEEFIYGNAIVSNGIYYFKSVIIRPNEILLTLNDTFAIIRHDNLMVENIHYISSITKIDVYITFGPSWCITITNTKLKKIIFQLNNDTFFIKNRLYSYDTHVDIEYFKTFHNFLELHRFSITLSFDKILNDAKYREFYRSAIQIKNGQIPKKIENATCIICMAHPPIYALICGHLLYCEACHEQTSLVKRRRIEYICPMCKTTHYRLIRMFY